MEANLSSKLMDYNAETPASILLVDDEENILSSLRRVFRTEPYTIFTAQNGEEGLAVLQENAIDLIISDMQMPKMNGAEFLEIAALKWPHTVRMLLTGYSDINATIAAINKGHVYRYISKPWDSQDLRLAVKQALEKSYLEKERLRLEKLTQKQNEELSILNSSLEQKVKERTAELNDTLQQLDSTHVQLKKSYISTVKIFSNLVEVREGRNAGHSRRVAHLTLDLAHKLGVQDSTKQTLLFASLLHDIGKISLSDELLNRPYNTLPKNEREDYEKHTTLAQALLISLEPLNDAAILIRSHHERYDGKGFPDGLSADKIPLGARILALANDFDALQIGTLSSQQFSRNQAIDFIKNNRGKRYDPNVVDAFIELVCTEENTEQNENDLCIKSAALKKGMILSRDLVTKDGLLLLSKEYILDEKLIKRIQYQEKILDYDFDIYITK